MAESHPRIRATIEGGCIVWIALFAVLMVSDQLQRIREDVWVVGGLVGLAVCYLYARSQTGNDGT